MLTGMRVKLNPYHILWWLSFWLARSLPKWLADCLTRGVFVTVSAHLSVSARLCFCSLVAFNYILFVQPLVVALNKVDIVRPENLDEDGKVSRRH